MDLAKISWSQHQKHKRQKQRYKWDYMKQKHVCTKGHEQQNKKAAYSMGEKYVQTIHLISN